MLTDDPSFIFDISIERNHEFHGDDLSKKFDKWIDKIEKERVQPSVLPLFAHPRDKTARPDALRNTCFTIDRVASFPFSSIDLPYPPKDRFFHLRIPWKPSKLERSRRRIRMVTGGGRVRASKSLRGGKRNASRITEKERERKIERVGRRCPRLLDKRRARWAVGGGRRGARRERRKEERKERRKERKGSGGG